jgi:hypothetical protein
MFIGPREVHSGLSNNVFAQALFNICLVGTGKKSKAGDPKFLLNVYIFLLMC